MKNHTVAIIALSICTFLGACVKEESVSPLPLTTEKAAEVTGELAEMKAEIARLNQERLRDRLYWTHIVNEALAGKINGDTEEGSDALNIIAKTPVEVASEAGKLCATGGLPAESELCE